VASDSLQLSVVANQQRINRPTSGKNDLHTLERSTRLKTAKLLEMNTTCSLREVAGLRGIEIEGTFSHILDSNQVL